MSEKPERPAVYRAVSADVRGHRGHVRGQLRQRGGGTRRIAVPQHKKSNSTLYIPIAANVINAIGQCAGVFGPHMDAARAVAAITNSKLNRFTPALSILWNVLFFAPSQAGLCEICRMPAWAERASDGLSLFSFLPERIADFLKDVGTFRLRGSSTGTALPRIEIAF